MNGNSIHGCTDIQIESIHPKNSNATTLRIMHVAHGLNGGQFIGVHTESDVVLFGLPESVTDRLKLALRYRFETDDHRVLRFAERVRSALGKAHYDELDEDGIAHAIARDLLGVSDPEESHE